ncbi:MAG: hypothetical protein AAGB34_05580 [Planctomycetota bacterium]
MARRDDPLHMAKNTPLFLLILGSAMAQIACRSTDGSKPVPPPPPRIQEIARSPVNIEAGHYKEAFALAKDVLRDNGFRIDRVDAAGGIIRSSPAISSGLATPWIKHSTGIRGSFDDTLNRERRVTVLRFSPNDGVRADDLRAYEGPLELRVEVQLQRVYEPGRRHSSNGVLLSSTTTGDTWQNQSLQPAFAVVVGTDVALAERLEAELKTHLD